MAQEEHDNQDELGKLFSLLMGNIAGAKAPKEGPESGDGPKPTIERLGLEVAHSAEPWKALAGFVLDVRAAESPNALDRRLAQRLEDAGILDTSDELPQIRLVRPKTTGLFYLRVDDQQMSYLAKLRILAVEGALNSALMSQALLDKPDEATMEEVVKLEQRVERSIVAQAATPLADLEGEPAEGDWHARHAIAAGIECLRLPWRLTARFRANAAAGKAAIEVDFLPPSVFPQTRYVDGLGVVAASANMRRRAATDYNLRLIVLMAAYVFHCTTDIQEVWIAGVVDSATGHACYCSAKLERSDLEGIDVAAEDPAALLRFLCAELDNDSGVLSPVRQGFSLDEEMFCPASRYRVIELDDEPLPRAAAEALGCKRVSQMAVDEHAARSEAGRVAALRMGPSTLENVKAVMDIGTKSDDADVKQACERVADLLVSGDLDENDPGAVQDAFAADGLSQEVQAAQHALLAGDAQACVDRLAAALAPLELEGRYRDDPRLRWRVFDDYADRALYNRLFAEKGVEVALAPRSYLDALVTLSAADLVLERTDAAVQLAKQAARLAPLSAQASLHYAKCLEQRGLNEAAIQEISRFLTSANDPRSIGLAYLQMASLQWKGGHMLASQACYQCASELLPATVVLASMQVASLLGTSGSEKLSPARVREVLRTFDIPLAPTEQVAEIIYEASAATVDAGLFRIARETTYLLVALTRDDIYNGVLRSLEDEPDR